MPFHLNSDRLEAVAALLKIQCKHRPSVTVLQVVKKIVRVTPRVNFMLNLLIRILIGSLVLIKHT